MARTATITLDDQQYTIHALNVGELEEASEALATLPSHKSPYVVVRIAMRRAEPKLNGSLDTIEPTFDQITSAFSAIAKLSGMTVTQNPQEPAPAPAAAS